MKSLPKKPCLEFLKKEAKALQAQHKRRDSSCCEQIRSNDTSFKSMTDDEMFSSRFSINDAQRIVAREYGYSSWATLKHYIQSLDDPLYNSVSDKKAYHQRIVGSYDERSKTYDNFIWAREWSIQTVEFCPPNQGEKVLDIACGTGTIAFYIADRVGPEGHITGVDISAGMIKKCSEKLQELDLKNMTFIYSDAEVLDFPTNSFDRMYCSAGLYWMINPLAALRHWCELLKPNGWLSFNAWPGNSFVWGNGERRALRKYGIESTVHEFSGSKKKLRQLVELAGFEKIDIHEVERGRWADPDTLKRPIKAGGYTPGQHPDPLEGVSEEILQLAQKDYEAEVDRLTTEKGVWHDMTTYFVCCQK